MRNQSQKALQQARRILLTPGSRLWSFGFQGSGSGSVPGPGWTRGLWNVQAPAGPTVLSQKTISHSPGVFGRDSCHTSPTILLRLLPMLLLLLRLLLPQRLVAAATKSVVTPAKALHMLGIVGGSLWSNGAGSPGGRRYKNYMLFLLKCFVFCVQHSHCRRRLFINFFALFTFWNTLSKGVLLKERKE